MNALLGELVERLRVVARADGAVFFTHSTGSWRAECVLGPLVGHPGTYRTYPSGMIAHAVERRGPVLMREVALGPQLAEVLASRGIRDALALPLISSQDSVLGALVLHSLSDAAFTAEVQGMAQALAVAITAVLERREMPEVVELNRQAVVEESELRFRAFMAAVPAMTWVKDDSGRYLFANQLMGQLLHSGRSLVGLTDFDFLPEEAARAVRVDDDAVRASAQVLYREEDIPTQDGVMHTWLTTKFPIVDSNGRVTVGGMGLDITEKKAAERALVRAELELEHLVDLLSEPVLIHHHGRIAHANGAMGQLIGVPREALLGKDLRELISAEGLADFEARLAAVAVGQNARSEQRMRHADGRALIVEASAQPITHRGAPATLALLRDATSRRAADQQLQMTDRLVSIGTLAAGVSHEITNPLSYVMSNLSLMLEQVPPEAGELHELARDALDGAERIGRIVEGMRTLARPADPSRRVAVSLEEVVGHALDLTANELRHRADIQVDLAHLPPVVGDETALVQVFVNLLSNAAHAVGAEASSRHHVRLGGVDLGDGRVRVTVSDDGVGIAREQVARVFDPFFTTKPVNVGTGLGLSVSHGIIAAHGGELTVESELGRGSTFAVTLPRARPSAPPARVALPVDDGARRARVLIVDDDQLVARALSRLLARHEVVLAPSAEAALALFGSREFDLVLCDVMMPGLDGPQLYARVSPGLAARFVFITGGAFTPSTRDFMAKTHVPVLTKPIDRARLNELVAAGIARRGT